MADVPQSSFIPKRTTNTTVRRPRTYNFFVIGILSYALFISAPVASAAVYVYHLYTERQLDAVVTEIDTAIADFSVADLQTVVAFDNRLRGTKTLLESHVSLPIALRILEEGTAKTVAFEDLTFERTDRSTITVTGELTAQNFDAAIFQREEYNKNALISDVVFEDLVFTPATPEDVVDVPDINVAGTFTFAATTILYNPNTNNTNLTPVAEDISGSNNDEIVDPSSDTSVNVGDELDTVEVPPRTTPEVLSPTTIIDPAAEESAVNDIPL